MVTKKLDSVTPLHITIEYFIIGPITNLIINNDSNLIIARQDFIVRY